MKHFLFMLLLCTFLQLSSSFNYLPAQSQINAAIPGDFADPSIIRRGNQYYAIGTSSEWAPHFPVYTSGNLKDWKQTGFIFDKAPEWTAGSFWAPEYFFHNNTYFVYYTARRKKDSASFIGVATSRFPDRDFKDHGIVIEHGKEAIDAFVYNDNGQLYITFKAYGLDNRPIEIIGSKLSPDGLKLQGELFTIFKDDKGIGLEGQSLLKKDDYYYLFYSAGSCCGVKCSYNVSIARSRKLEGPYENYHDNPALQENTDWKCSGHGTFTVNNQGKYFYLYHAYNKVSTVFGGRQALLAELLWPERNSWPVFKMAPSSKADQDLRDPFNTTSIAKHWQWDFRNSLPIVRQQNGNLYLSGTINASTKTGVVLTVRPRHIGFEATTVVVNHNSALKGLAYYGDANAALGIGVTNDKVVVWRVKDTLRTELAHTATTSTAPVEMRIAFMPDKTCRFFYKQGQSAWKRLVTDHEVSAEFLPQWDRSARIGLHYKGEIPQEAVFSSFELTYF
jgi:beta-xylosidase